MAEGKQVDIDRPECTPTSRADNIPEADAEKIKADWRTQMTHSPVPWILKKLPKDPDRDWDAYSVLDINGDTVLGGEQHDNWAGKLPDKKFIIRAVNAHDALVTALEWIATNSTERAAITVANDALTLARNGA